MVLKHLFRPQMLLLMLIGFFFLKIYQHNLIIKLNYEYQRLEKKKSQLEKDRNELLSVYLKTRDPHKVLAIARDEWGMVPLKIHQVESIVEHPEIDFFSTTSSDDLLRYLGVYDVVMGVSGGSGHVGA
jgi:hypothetical protein